MQEGMRLKIHIMHVMSQSGYCVDERTKIVGGKN